MSMIHASTSSSQKGFTLLEMSIVVAIVGLITVVSIRIALPLLDMAHRMETTEKMKKIQEALAVYAVQNYRIPCPGVPVETTANPVSNGFGYEKNNGIALPNAASRCGTNPAIDWRGIVPFKTLGIPSDTIRDAWGNYFTYAVSPAFTLPSAGAQTSVQANCRTREWFYMTSDASTPTYKSRNAAKAGFCCPGDGVMGSSTNLRIRDSSNQETPYRSRIRNMASNEAASVDTPYQNFTAYVPIEQTPVGVVYTIVSHGPNGGATAFDGISNSRSIIPSATTNICENSNADETSEGGSRTYRDCLIAEDVDMNQNDDIVVWQTQDMIFASENQSCAVP